MTAERSNGGTIFIDCGSGVSGDMMLGALVDLGADVGQIKEELGKLAIGYFDLVAEKAERNGIQGTNLHVIVRDRPMHDFDYGVPGHYHTAYADIAAMIEKSALSPRVKEIALQVFALIAEAEGAVHGVPVAEVAFHEVGAMDSILDIVGTAVAVDLLGIQKVYVGEIHDGRGTVMCRHGLIPVPVPAVLEMLKKGGFPLITEASVQTEMVTPTGLGLLLGLGAVYAPQLSVKPTKIGYGFGKRETGRFPAVRIIMGEIDE
ncbi:MAG: LarC family nickel insertion protein [Clostridiales Family XIII bacterium]|nr:LarC family nickel insertion protein [Clostridiales Family XIII bacterium]